MKIESNVKEALSNGYFEGSKFFLTGTLDRKTYVSTNEVIESLGGKWSRKEKAHVFEGEQEELESALRSVIESWEVESITDVIKKFQFFPTPKDVAEFAVNLAGICARHSVLEPSAWIGNILNAIIESTEELCIDLFAIELNPENVKVLNNKYPLVATLEKDFLAYDKLRFDRIVMNPPFSKWQDVKHVIHAYSRLKEGGRIVAILPSSVKHKGQKIYEEFRNLNPEFHELPEGSFKESGTMVSTVIAVINKPDGK